VTFRLRKDFQDLRARIIKLAFLTKISDSKIPNSALGLIVTHCNIPKWQLWHKLLGQKFTSKIPPKTYNFDSVPSQKHITKTWNFLAISSMLMWAREPDGSMIWGFRTLDRRKSVKMAEIGKTRIKTWNFQTLNRTSNLSRNNPTYDSPVRPNSDQINKKSCV